ncbi:MAG: ATP-binding protein [Oliverpabstia sp.]
MSKLNISPCTIKDVKQNLLAYYLRALEHGCQMSELDAIFLWSSPGIGKSQMTRQIADEIAERTGRRVKFVEIRLSECSIFELLGLMHRNPESNTVVYDAPPIYSAEDENMIVIYLFDEMDKASKQLQAAALHLVLDKEYWQYKLPKNSIVIAAGNPENIEGEMFSKFAPELNNRFRHYLLEADFPTWQSWAKENGVNPFVIGFLEANQHLLYAEDAGADHTAFNTPRTWMKVSNYLNLMYGDGEISWDMAYLDIVGYLGVELGLQFKTFCTTKGLMPKMEEIISGHCQTVPTKADIKDAVSKSLINYIYSHKDTMTQREWAFAREYIERFPEEYAVVFYRNIAALSLQHIMIRYMTSQERIRWKKRYGSSMTYGMES